MDNSWPQWVIDLCWIVLVVFAPAAIVLTIWAWQSDRAIRHWAEREADEE